MCPAIHFPQPEDCRRQDSHRVPARRCVDLTA